MSTNYRHFVSSWSLLLLDIEVSQDTRANSSQYTFRNFFWEVNNLDLQLDKWFLFGAKVLRFLEYEFTPLLADCMTVVLVGCMTGRKCLSMCQSIYIFTGFYIKVCVKWTCVGGILGFSSSNKIGTRVKSTTKGTQGMKVGQRIYEGSHTDFLVPLSLLSP